MGLSFMFWVGVILGVLVCAGREMVVLFEMSVRVEI